MTSSTPSFSTDQEAFWNGSFGNNYTDRNDGDIIRRSICCSGGRFWRTGAIASCFEIGCNKGLNLDAIRTLAIM